MNSCSTKVAWLKMEGHKMFFLSAGFFVLNPKSKVIKKLHRKNDQWSEKQGKKDVCDQTDKNIKYCMHNSTNG